MAYQFDIDAIEDYYEALCTSNLDVLHNIDGRKSFARFHSRSQINEIKKSASKNIVVVADYTGRRVGDKDDKMLRRQIVLRFAVYAENNTEESKTAAIRKAEQIMFDFMTEMERRQEADLDGDVECGPMHFLKPEEFSWEPIEDQPWLINHFGWDLIVSFNVFMPKHDAAKWS